MTTTGSELLNKILGHYGAPREKIILDALVNEGAIPPFLTKFVPVTVTGVDSQGTPTTIKYFVSPDVLSVGTDQDFFRVPLLPETAQKVADHFSCILPVKRMVDQIYQAAEIKLAPFPISPKPGEPNRGDSRSYQKSHERIQKQLAGKDYLGKLIAGIKKDVVLSDKIPANPDRVFIYGWHELDGKAIQPLSWIHTRDYVDYSHGIRLVSKVCEVNGVSMDIEVVLKGKQFSKILTGDIPLPVTRY